MEVSPEPSVAAGDAEVAAPSQPSGSGCSAVNPISTEDVGAVDEGACPAPPGASERQGNHSGNAWMTPID